MSKQDRNNVKGFGSKVYHVLRTEGVGSLLNRTQRYVRYRAKRAAVNSGPTLKEWEALKGRYQGRRAFLLGNGPSLNLTELYLLRDEATMCFNRFDLMLERLNWVPKFYTTIDDRVLLDTVDIVNELSAIAEHAFFPDIHPYCVDFRDVIAKRPNVHWLFLNGTTFSDRLPYCGINKTVANVGIQILAYLGFTEIVLLGVDMTYSIPKTARLENARDVEATEDDDESHFDPRYFGKGRKFHVPLLDETFLKFREARNFFEARGVTIRNGTVGGVLEEFPRTSLQTLLGFSIDEKREIFKEMVEARLLKPGLDVLDAIVRAPEAQEPDEVDTRWDVFRVPSEQVNRFVLKHVLQFVPFGPLEGTHLFVSRRMLRPFPLSG